MHGCDGSLVLRAGVSLRPCAGRNCRRGPSSARVQDRRHGDAGWVIEALAGRRRACGPGLGAAGTGAACGPAARAARLRDPATLDTTSSRPPARMIGAVEPSVQAGNRGDPRACAQTDGSTSARRAGERCAARGARGRPVPRMITASVGRPQRSPGRLQLPLGVER